MFKSNSKFPKFFVYTMIALALCIFIGMFFSSTLVAVVYFFAIIIATLLLLLDKKYGTLLTNYKLTFLLFEIVNLIAIISVIYYESPNHSQVLLTFLIFTIIVEVLMMIIDVFVLKNETLTKRRNLIIDFCKLCSMICLMTYFFNVSKLYFSVVTLSFEFINLVVKITVGMKMVKLQPSKDDSESKEDIADFIHSSDENNGDDE